MSQRARPAQRRKPRASLEPSKLVVERCFSSPPPFFSEAEEKDEPSTPSHVTISKFLNIYQYTTKYYLTLLHPHLATTSRSWLLGRRISTPPIPRRITGGSADRHRL